MRCDQERLRAQRERLSAELPPVIGHRGAALHAPENTLASIEEARRLGATWVEFDVKLSADRVPFLLHDDDLPRTTDATGPAGRLAMADLAALDAGSWFSTAFAGERLPTLETVLDHLRRHAMRANIELKPTPGEGPRTAREVVALLERVWPDERTIPLLSSFDPAALATAAELAPDIPRGLLVHRSPDAVAWRRRMERCDCASLHLDHRFTRKGLLAALRREGIPVLLYTVNDGRRARSLLEAGATSIISDAPERILRAWHGSAR
ncbi:MAG: glycerophosphodiester phosphodiesterase [Geminicoccaceae bacterium]|nr:glycerophosphodiester phosphodiesterase [Geminicoccaceae bacterium]